MPARVRFMSVQHVLAAADFLRDFRAANPNHPHHRVPSDLLNEIEMEALAASFSQPPHVQSNTGIAPCVELPVQPCGISP